MRTAAVVLALLCFACVGATDPWEDPPPANDTCWYEQAPNYATHLGVATVTIVYCGLDDEVDRNTLKVLSYDADGKYLADKSYKAVGKPDHLDEYPGLFFSFGDAGDLGAWFLEYDTGIWNGSLAACTSMDPGESCVDVGKEKCGKLAGGAIKLPYFVSWVDGSKMLSCRFRCTNVGGWQYGNCTKTNPTPQPAPTCPCEGQPTCDCGG